MRPPRRGRDASGRSTRARARRRSTTATSAYRLLLRAFPSDFRTAYGRDLVQAFEDARSDLVKAGPVQRARFWLRTVADVVRHGLAERWGRMTGRSGPVPPRRPGSGVDRGSLGTRLEIAFKELRIAARSLTRQPGFAVAFVSILGLSLAGATTLWGTIYHVSIAPLGFQDEDRLVRVWYRTHRASTDEDFGLSDGLLETLRERSRTLAAVGYVMIAGTTTVLDREDAPPERVSRMRVSDDFFEILGAEAAAGRLFVVGDAQRHVVLLSHGTWQRRFGSSPDVLGRTLRLGGVPHTVVGVLPEGFRWLDSPDAPIEFWTAVPLLPSRFDPFYYFSVARLHGDATIESAQAEVEAIFERVHDVEYAHLRARPDRLATVRPLREDFLGPAGPRIRVLAVALALVGLLGASNVAMLLLIRAVGRARESAVRVALGGGARRVAAPILAELGILVAASVTVAFLLSWLALATVRRYGALGLVRADAIGVSSEVLAGGTVLAGLIAAAALAAVTVGLRRWGSRAVLQAMADSVTGGPLPRALRAPLVVTQVAVSLALVSTAGLLGQSFLRLGSLDPGFDPGALVSGSVTLPLEPYWSPVAGAEGRALRISPALADLRRRLREGLAAHPAVRDVSLATHAPLSGRYGGFTPFRPEWFDGPEGEMPGGRRWISSNDVDPDFLPLLGVDLTEGRWLTWDDDDHAPPVALVSKGLAEAMWPDGDAVGSRFRGWAMRLDDDGRIETVSTWITVVGVVEDLRQWELRTADETVYRTLAQAYETGRLAQPSSRGPRLRLFVRPDGDAAAAVAHMRAVVEALLPGVPLDDVRTLRELVGEQLREPRFYVAIFSTFGALAVTLALGGIAAIIGYGVSRRRREIGVRLALGAWSSGVFRLVAIETLALAGIGVVLGLALSYAGGRMLESLLFEVAPQDGRTMVCSAALLMLMAVLAAMIPTRRALAIDPARSLRHD